MTTFGQSMMAIMKMGNQKAMSESSRSTQARPRKVTPDMVRKMQKLSSNGMAMTAIGRKLGVNETTVRRHLKGRS